MLSSVIVNVPLVSGAVVLSPAPIVTSESIPSDTCDLPSGDGKKQTNT